MANEFYVTGAQRAERVGDLFATIAPRYDLMNDLQSFGLHRCWKRRLVAWADVRSGQRALDVCCGTGDIAFGLARRGAQVVGVDFSEAMLSIAESRRRKAERKRGAREAEGDAGSGRQALTSESGGSATLNPQFVQGDAQQLSFPNDWLDVVTIGYGLRNLASWEAGLREMQRVVKPGGRLLVLDFGKPDHALWRGIYFGYLRLGVPILGWLFSGSAGAYAYILESLRHFPPQRGIAARMEQLGLVEVRTCNLLGGVMGLSTGRKAN